MELLLVDLPSCAVSLAAFGNPAMIRAAPALIQPNQ
jgi:hypothetical protein